jgi:hypothetical protein
MVVVSLLPPVDAGTHHQDGLTQKILHPFGGNFRIPIWYSADLEFRRPGQVGYLGKRDSMLCGYPEAPRGNRGGPNGPPGWRST